MSALALSLALLPVFLLLLVCLVLVPRVVHCLLLLCHACLWMIHPCIMQGIQGVLVVCCLCANPPATTWTWVGRVPRGGRVPKVGFRVRPKICNQAQVPGGYGEVRSHLPSTRRFLTPDSCHLDTDWASGNQWAGRRCVTLHDRGFGC